MADNAVLSSKDYSKPLVSILVPSYNHERYVIECLESIKGLDYDKLELIVSDDCSSDGTFALVEDWAGTNGCRFQRTLVVRQEKNLGIVGNLRFLFNSARGDYLAYIASDDMFMKSAISCRVEIFQKNRNIDAVFGNAQNISVDGAVINKEHIPKRIARELLSSKLLLASLLLKFSAAGPAMMLRREAVLEKGSLGPLPIDLRIEDLYIYIRMASRGKLRFVNSVVSKYRSGPGGLCKSLGSRVLMEQYVQAYELNRRLVSGFDRFVLESRLARYKVELNKNDIAFYRLRVFVLQLVLILERTIMFAGAYFTSI